MRVLTSLLIVAGLVQHVFSLTPEQIVETRSAYTDAVQLLQKCTSFVSDSREETDLKIDLTTGNGEPDDIWIGGSISVHLWANNFRLRSLRNRPLENFLDVEKEEGRRQTVPSLGIEEVIKRARKYMKEAGWEITDDRFQLCTIEFDKTFASCWRVRWSRAAGGYQWDDFVEAYTEHAYAIFHESLGLVAIGNGSYSPIPVSLFVNTRREQVIAKAALAVPLVQRTTFYRQARASGFVVSGLKSCELRVAVPNWLLDPERAVWIRDKPPEETRLCWVVQFTTVDPKAAERGINKKTGQPIKLLAPDILVYIDAGTGEVVGANFT